MIRVLIVEDSPVVQEFLLHIFGSDPEIRVIGIANDGEEAVRVAAEKKPDVITMDINMPKMNGLDATQRIMETNPIPIVIVSGNWNPGEVETTFRAMEAGAVSLVQRPSGIGHPEHEKSARDLLSTIKLMSEVKVVKRWPRRAQKPSRVAAVGETPTLKETQRPSVIALGASTGGPVAIKTILSRLPEGFRVPILIVQHIAKGFLRGMLDWVSETTSVTLKVADYGENVRPGHVYFAPEGFNMGIDRSGKIFLSDSGPGNQLRPSTSYLFRSVADSYGAKAVGVILSGMGRDGAEELRSMKSKGAVTIAQDKESSIIFGMPGAAAELDAAMYLLPPEKIADMLMMLADGKMKNAMRTDN